MAYAATNPPVNVTSGLASGAAIWTYSSADVDSDVDATGYFTNGDALGLDVGDIMFVHDTAGVMTVMFVTAVTAGGAATVAAATVTV